MSNKANYIKLLEEIAQQKPRSDVLNPFWTSRREWPKGNKQMIFIGDAIDEIGRARFSLDWLGNEFGVKQRLGEFPSFQDTLSYHKAKTGDRGPFEHDRVDYDKSVAAWSLLKNNNQAAHNRLMWSLNWMFTKGRYNDIKTYLRRVDTEVYSGEYAQAPPGFWENENPIRHRLRNGKVIFDSGNDTQDEYYIFFSRSDLKEHFLDAKHFETPSDLEKIHYSPYLRAIIEAVRELKITTINQPDKSVVEAFLVKNWKGSEQLSGRMLDRMSSVTRESDSQKGAWKETRRVRRKSPKRSEEL